MLEGEGSIVIDPVDGACRRTRLAFNLSSCPDKLIIGIMIEVCPGEGTEGEISGRGVGELDCSLGVRE